ncbi:MAG: hypothetical protein CMN76_10515 [Spirochaetaceae bacterium]|nr:hypothetical protein [Spirochaetaceae bacterium]
MPRSNLRRFAKPKDANPNAYSCGSAPILARRWFSPLQTRIMPMTVDEIKKELEHLSDEDKRLLLESLQSALEGQRVRRSLKGVFLNTKITDQDLQEARLQWR